MQYHKTLPQTETCSLPPIAQPLDPATSTQSGPRSCPICAAPMVSLRGQDRCSRCHFVFCVGCEDGYGNPAED